MRHLGWLSILLLASASTAAANPSTSVPPVNQPVSGPESAIDALVKGYRRLSADQVIATYTADYRFHSIGDSLALFPFGIGRDADAASVRSLLGGVIKDGDTLSAPADSVGMVVDGIREGIDPEHPDSSQCYSVLTAGRFTFGFRTTQGVRIDASSSVHVFHVVRGDVAQLVRGQVADDRHWYIRRWLENVAGVRDALGERQGDCGDPPPPAPGPRSATAASFGTPARLAIRPLANPACPSLAVTCDLPGVEAARLEVYDVSGRRLNKFDVPISGPGTITVEAGRGVRLRPGVYWVRLGQSTRLPTTRMVVVAR
jgi:hypothetical protein